MDPELELSWIRAFVADQSKAAQRLVVAAEHLARVCDELDPAVVPDELRDARGAVELALSDWRNVNLTR